MSARESKQNYLKMFGKSSNDYNLSYYSGGAAVRYVDYLNDEKQVIKGKNTIKKDRLSLSLILIPRLIKSSFRSLSTAKMSFIWKNTTCGTAKVKKSN